MRRTADTLSRKRRRHVDCAEYINPRVVARPFTNAQAPLASGHRDASEKADDTLVPRTGIANDSIISIHLTGTASVSDHPVIAVNAQRPCGLCRARVPLDKLRRGEKVEADEPRGRNAIVASSVELRDSVGSRCVPRGIQRGIIRASRRFPTRRCATSRERQKADSSTMAQGEETIAASPRFLEKARKSRTMKQKEE